MHLIRNTKREWGTRGGCFVFSNVHTEERNSGAGLKQQPSIKKKNEKREAEVQIKGDHRELVV